MFKIKNKKIIVFSGVFLALLISFLWYSFSYSYTEYGEYESAISVPAISGETPYIESPGWMAISPNNGNIYLSDEGSRQVLVFDSNDNYLRKISFLGEGSGQFANPQGLAIGTDGSGDDIIFLADAHNNKILKFNYRGEFITEWGSLGSSTGEFNKPRDIALDTEGYVYVVDFGNNRIQKFDSNGTYITEWGQPGADYSQFNSPQGIVIDYNNNVYVTDTHNNRVQKFDSNGTYITQWGSWGTGSLNFWDPMGMLIDSQNNIYVIDQGDGGKIRKFNLNGDFLEIVIFGESQYSGENDGVLFNPIDIEMNSWGDIYVTDNDHRIQKFSLGTKTDFFQDLEIFYQNNGGFNRPDSLIMDLDGNIYVSDYGNNRIQKFDSSGNYLSQFGSYGSGDSQFKAPSGMAVDSFNNLYVSDSGNNRIQKFDSSGNYLSQFGSYGAGDGYFINPINIAIDSIGNIYVTDNNYRIQKFNSNGEWLMSWGSYGSRNDQFMDLSDIFIDPSDNIYLVDQKADRVQKFDSSGNYLSQFGSSGSGDGEFIGPTGIFVGFDNNIYVVDNGNNRIQKFDSSFNYLSQFGSGGSNPGEFSSPGDIIMDSSDNIYIADSGNSRIQKFDNTFFPETNWGQYFSLYISPFWNISINPNNDHLFVSDGEKVSVSEFDNNGDFIGYMETNNYPVNPIGSVFDSLGNAYIFDKSDCLIKEYDSSSPQRQFIDSWGGCGSDSGNFNIYERFEATVDSNNNIYVVDRYNHRIQKFDSSGTYITEWSITNPVDIVVDSYDNVYVASNVPHFITKYDSSGNQIMIIERDINNIAFQNIYGIAIDSSDNIYVSDNNGFIQYLKRFDSTGAPIDNIYIGYSPYGIVIDSLDRIYIGDSSEASGIINRLNYGDFSGYIFDSEIAGESEFLLGTPFSVALGSLDVPGLGYSDILLVSDISENNFKIFSVNDEIISYLATMGSYGTSSGKFIMPSKTILVDNYIYVADAGNHRIGRLDVFTEELIYWGEDGDGPGQFGGESLIGDGYLLGLAADSDGNIYVADTFNSRVQKFDADGNYITEWEASYPFGIAIDHDSNIFTSNPFFNIIEKFDSNGTKITEFGETGSENGQFNLVAGLYVDFNNNLYVADGGNDRIQKFDNNGNFLDKWGQAGSDLGQFSQPLDVAVDNDGNIYVADSENSRIQVLYILPQKPYNLSVSNLTSNSITLSWEGNTYSYYIENITNSDASGWIQNNSYTFSNLSCGENYSFRVKGKNYSGEETDWSDVIEYSIICPNLGSGNESSYFNELPVPVCDYVEYSNWEPCKNGFDIQFRGIKKTDPANCYLSIEQRRDMERPCSLNDYEEDQKIVDNDKVDNIDQGQLLNIKNITSREKSLVSLVDSRLVNKLKGSILLQVENYGELWYLSPVDNLKYYAGSPLAIFNIMRLFGLGVSNDNFALFEKNGVPDRLAGRILLRVEDNGEAYYVNPITMELHYLSRPHEAFEIFKELSLGISNINIRKIEVGWQ